MINSTKSHSLVNTQLLSPKKLGEKRCFSLIAQNTALRSPLENYIAEKYQKAHGASITEFLPLLMEMSIAGSAKGALGLRPGQYRPMFLEQYLDSPIEQQVAALFQQPIDRLSLIEIGNLVVTSGGSGLLLFAVMTATLAQSGFQWMVFTATEEVERMIHRLGFEPEYLTMAEPSRLKDGVESWGAYYQCKPKVMVGNVEKARAVLAANPLVAKLLAEYQDEIQSLADSLSVYRHTCG